MTEPMSMPSQTGGKGGAGGYCSLSDHFSVEVLLSLSPSPSQQAALAAAKNPAKVPEAMLVDVAGETRAEEAQLTGQVGEKEGERYLPTLIIDEILALVATYTKRQEGEYFWRIFHFWASLPVLVACHVGVWWSTHNAVAFVLVFVAWVIAVTGGLDGLIGFLFMGSGRFSSGCSFSRVMANEGIELRALKEFEEEMGMYRALAVVEGSKVYSNGNSSRNGNGSRGSGQFLL